MTTFEITATVLASLNFVGLCVIGAYVLGILRGDVSEMKKSVERIEAAFMPAPGSLSVAAAVRERGNGAALIPDAK